MMKILKAITGSYGKLRNIFIYAPVNALIFPLYWLLTRIPFYRKLPILAQRGVASLLTILIVLSSVWSYSYLFVPKAQATWFDDSWSYRQRIPIDTHTASETNVYNEMTVDTATLTTDKLQADCDDLRFTKQDGQVLPYQIVSGCDSATTTIRVGFDTMPIAPFNIYMYYGNPSAAIGSITLTHTACGNGCAEGTAAAEEKGTAPVAYWKFDEGQGVIANNSQWKANGTMTNSVTNPSFETNTTGWTQVQTTATRQSTASPGTPFGSYSVSTVFTTQAGSGWRYEIASGIAASTAYTVSGWFKTTSATCTLLFVADETVGQGVYSTTITATGGTWQRFTVTATTDSDATGTGYIDAPRCNGAETVEVDGVQLQTGSSPTNYCDGSVIGNGTHTWTGTAHASTSTCSNGTDGMISGTTWQPEDQCIAGKCLRFDGVDDYAVSGAASVLNTGDNFTLSAWIKRGQVSGAGTEHIFYGGTNSFALQVNSSNQLRITKAGVSAIAVSNGTITDSSNWHYVAWTKNGATTKLYIDAVETTGAVTDATISTPSAQVYIGTTTSAGSWFKGAIDEPKIYAYDLTAAQIKANYVAKSGNESSSVLGATTDQNLGNGLVGYWKMDESSGNAADSSGNGLTLTNNGTTTFLTGKFGNGSEHVPASSQYLSTATTISGIKTVSFWVNPDSTTNYYVSLTSSAYITSSSGTISATGFTSPIIYVNGVSTTTIAADVWSLVTVVSDTAINADTFYVGRQGSNYFDGTMDEVRTYNRALSLTEVTQLYNFAPGPVGYWDFEEGTGSSAFDKSGNSATGTITGAVYTAGKYGKALNLDGNDYIGLIADNARYTIGSGDFTMESWVNFTSTAGIQAIMAHDEGGGTTNKWIFWYNGGNLGFHFNGPVPGGQTPLSTAWNPTTSTWYHVAITKSGSSYVSYVNGVQLGIGTNATAIPDPAIALEIGRAEGSNYFNGKLDDAKIYNYARTSGQVVQDMNGGHPAPGSPVGSALLHYKFDEGSANTCSGGTNDACNSGSVGSTIDGAFSGNTSYTQAGKFNRGAAFDGTTDFITIPAYSGFNFGSGGLTYSVWAEVDNFSIDRFILDRTTGTTPLIDLVVSTSATVVCQVRDTVGTFQQITSTRTLSANTWYHLACVRDPALDKWIVYINGVADTSPTDTTALMDMSSISLKIGDHSDGANAMLGTLDEFKIYNYALTAAEVKLDMNRGAAQVLGSISDNSSYQKQAANQEYCVPGDATSCAAPVGRWDFEEGTSTNAFDKSGNGYTGTVSGATWTTGKPGKALSFDGDDYVDMGNNLDIADNTFSISAWIKYTTSAAGNNIIAGKSNSGSGQSYMLQVTTTNNYPRFLACNGTACNAATASTAANDGLWHHIVGTQSGNTSSLYVDGKLIATDATNTITTVSNANAFNVGRRYSGDIYFTGTIDQVRVFDYARTPAQIAWDYNKGGPVGWWKFDECQGTVANDSSGNLNTGTITVGATGTYTSVGTCPVSSASTMWYNGAIGKRNYSLAFDGTDDYVTIADPASGILDFAGDFSVELWFNASSLTASSALLGKGFSGSGPGYGLRLSGAGTGINFWIDDGAGGEAGIELTHQTTLSTGTWYHVVGTRTGGTAKIYVNGIVGTTTGSSSTTLVNSSALTFGARATPINFFPGQLDNPRVYNYALTATQIKTLMNEGAVRYGPVTGAP